MDSQASQWMEASILLSRLMYLQSEVLLTQNSWTRSLAYSLLIRNQVAKAVVIFVKSETWDRTLAVGSVSRSQAMWDPVTRRPSSRSNRSSIIMLVLSPTDSLLQVISFEVRQRSALVPLTSSKLATDQPVAWLRETLGAPREETR